MRQKELNRREKASANMAGFDLLLHLSAYSTKTKGRVSVTRTLSGINTAHNGRAKIVTISLFCISQAIERDESEIG